LEAVKKFIASPEAFVGNRVGAMSAAQIQANPFGDYAPQSTQIQGILKGMYDAFTADIEKDNAEEADKQKAFEDLMATKKQELATLETTLEKQEHDEAKKTKELSDNKITRDDTIAQLKADEIFFQDTKDGCKQKAGEWAERSRLRTEELTGIAKAVQILSSPEARQTFQSSVTTFVQLSSDTKTVSHQYRKKAYTQLRALAAKYQSTSLAEIAVGVKTGGHFDKVMVMIDKMIALLRTEEAEDIAHRDRCESSQNKNGNDMEDLDSDISKAGATIERLEDRETELKNTISALEGEITQTKTDMEDLLEMRNQEDAAFKKALKDDADAVKLIEEAIVSLSEFYKNNKIPLELVQKKDPEYTVDEDKAPETTWSGGDYGGRKGESGGIIAILEMIKEDTQNEMKTSRTDDADAEATYEKNRAALKETLDAQAASKVQAEKELADTETKIADYEEYKNGKAADLGEEQALEASINKDCAWVKSNFQSRRDKRKAEMDGLVEAKNFLAGVEAGDDDELM
jgi:phage shock protein A